MPSTTAKSVNSVSVLTLNCWGLWLVSKDRKKRTMQLGEYLSRSFDLDIVALQEVWVEEDVELLTKCGREAGLCFPMHFKSGIFGSGLLTLSRWPILESSFHQYSAAGDPLAIACGDYLAAKGFGWVRLASPIGPLDVFNTHTHANYSHKVKGNKEKMTHSKDDGSLPLEGLASASMEVNAATTINCHIPADSFAPYRISQMWELVQGMHHISKVGNVGVILAGDLNSKPDSLEHVLLRTLLPELRDSWLEHHSEPSMKSGTNSGEGFTCRGPGCTYKSTRQVPERIDYVLSTLKPVMCRVCLQRSPLGISYSDHFAVQTVLSCTSELGRKEGDQEVHGGSNKVSRKTANRTMISPLSVQMVGEQMMIMECLKIVEFGAVRCATARSRALMTAVMAFVTMLICLALLNINTCSQSCTSALAGACRDIEWSRSFFSNPFEPRSCSEMSSALQAAGQHALGLLLMILSAFWMLLLLKGQVADSANERALSMSAAQLRLLLNKVG
ncbi:hypothetical protein CEUSTIGMA_g794.t1 [Chlamydomonas eustigma]|uniref:Endonuclease/exonuclease/phosphatase domain-containing protein n=1 Tax=Chlamydomonas eustigma TaxID=1157962 RepID=A0A250WRC0_9CHLO|nr:hypothetical protein CEUSTIGMA_g794.t1 [Chlamydomonas eustigma]|eukprot:GAX73341.1 hypothetical protein CEUSTIGMA_g794.t1 [Chlamydomonas eustigma]